MAPPVLATTIDDATTGTAPRPRLGWQAWASEAQPAVLRHGALSVAVGLFAGAVLLHPAVALGAVVLIGLPADIREDALDAVMGAWVDFAGCGLALGAAAGLTYASGAAVLPGVAWAALALLSLRTANLGLSLLHLLFVRERHQGGRRTLELIGGHALGGPLGRSAPHAAAMAGGVLAAVAMCVLWGTGVLPAHLDGVAAAVLICGSVSALRAWWRRPVGSLRAE